VDQQIRFCSVAGRRVATAVSGAGPPLLLPSWWTSHVELDWHRPGYRAFVRRLSTHHTVIRYDRLGTGLSDRERPSCPDAQELEAATALGVLDALGLDRVDLFGLSCAGCIAVRVAAQQPQRTGRLVLYGSYADGRAIAPPDTREALVALVRSQWGLGSRLLAELFLPEASPEDRRAFVAFQRGAASPRMAAQLLELMHAFDVRDHVGEVQAPTLVLHRRQDRAVPFELGVELAAALPDARLVELSGAEHLPWTGEAGAVLRPALAFLAGQEAAPLDV
jgi:pimeloyl-ACP methyl ester carboxylesterase